MLSEGLELGVGSPQAVHLVRRILLPSGIMAEASGDLVKRSSLGFGHHEVGEDEEAQQQHGEDDEDVGATQLLQRIQKSYIIFTISKLKVEVISAIIELYNIYNNIYYQCILIHII